MSERFRIPTPKMQVDFSRTLITAKTAFLQRALLRAVRHCDVDDLDREVNRFVPKDSRQRLAARGLRAELLFALPVILRTNPRLIGYYRLLLGYSQKVFYTKNFGLNGYLRMESRGHLDDTMDESLPELCSAINNASAYLLESISDDHLTADHLHDLSLLTFGPQLRGGRNVSIGTSAVQEVFEVIAEIVGVHGRAVSSRRISVQDATGRQIEIRFSADPDIEMVTVGANVPDAPILAIEVKGGEDRSNAHNRLGEAEKSHLKARAKGFTELWTITNVQELSPDDRRAASPTTTAFFDLSDLTSRQGEAYDLFRETLLQRLRLPKIPAS